MKKPLPSNVVSVVVRTGNENKARAGKGGYACTASSTSSAYFAARHAAAKFFRCTENRISLSYQGEVDRVVTFTAIRCAKPATFITIEFVDKGQDFASWVVCLDTGHVIDCKPFQPKNGSRNVRKISQVIASAGYAANFSIKSASPAG